MYLLGEASERNWSISVTNDVCGAVSQVYIKYSREHEGKFSKGARTEVSKAHSMKQKGPNL